MGKLFRRILLLLFFSPALVVGQSSQLSDMDGFIQTYIDTTHKAGISACIIKGDTVYWKGSFGFANLGDSIPVTDTKFFNAMSNSKTITATCLMMEWEDDLISLDENVNGILPFQIDNPFQDPDFITPRQILTHSSCILDNNWLAYLSIGDPTIPLSTFLEDYLSPGGAYYNSNNFSSHIPGSFSSYSYSNIGYGLNGYLIELCNPLPVSFNAFVKTRIHDPLNMDRSAWYLDELNMDNLATGYSYSNGQYTPWDHYGVPFYPAMALRTNSIELSRYVMMLLNKGEYGSNVLLQPETVDSMFTVQFDFLYTGLGLRRETVQCITGEKIQWGHKGGGAYGWSGEIQFCREENTALLYLSNSSEYSPELVQRMFEYAAMIVISTSPLDITSSSFTARWHPAPDAEGYLLDLAHDSGFINIVSGYQNFNTGNDTSLQIEGLLSDSTYYYRLRAYNEYDTGAYSGSFKVHTLGVGIDERPFFKPSVWSKGNSVCIDIDQTVTEPQVKIYSLDGKLLHAGKLIQGINNINVDTEQQLIIVAVINQNKLYTQKLMLY